ncbi:MAG: right-handed parallel beta-helix repeat-containing protein [Flavobacteriales bacterium]|nr:right-handed parallel beta-helix repeat-containing protein [Flavobacteriales bacterium]
MPHSKRFLSTALVGCIGLTAALGQACQFVDPPAPQQMLGGGSGTYASWNGWYMPTNGMVRILVVPVEVNYANPIYDPTPPGGTAGWPAHQMPTWADNPDSSENLFDWDVPTGPASGLFTRYYQQASSGNFIALGDYLQAPSNHGVFQVYTPDSVVSLGDVFAAVDSALGNTISTAHGYNSINDFDRWTIGSYNDPLTGPGLPKLHPSTETPRKFDHVMIIWRNRRGNNGTGFASSNPIGLSILGYGMNSYSSFGAYDRVPITITRHEFAHLLYGSNNFHTAGGGKDVNGSQYFIAQSSGWSNLGLWNGSLLSWNGWDRQRMGWKAAGSVYEIAARNAANTAFVNGDLDASLPSQAGTYTLRDFVQTGDAIRIKLPFTDPTSEYPEFLWVENHQGINVNLNPFDKWNHEPDPGGCIQGIVPGLQMYLQIDKEVRESSSYNAVYGGPGDYLRPLDASGHYDIHFNAAVDTTYCVCWECPKYPFVRGQKNPFTGSADRHFVALDLNANVVLSYADHRLNDMEDVNGAIYDRLYTLGNARQVFTPGGNRKVGVGTNPSSATMMNSVGYNNDVTPNKNLRRIYLNGVSVELDTMYADGSIQVQVRFDDVDVTNDARWCADEIQLNPVATSTGYSLNVTAGNTITLDRGTTATRRDAPQPYNGQQVFTSPTLMRCPANTWLNLAPGGGFVVDNGSTLRLESGSRMDVGNGAVLRVKRGGKLELMGGSVLNVLPGGQVIIEEDVVNGNDGRLVYYPNARINMEAANSVLEIAGMLDIQANATFTPARNGDPSTTYGLVKFTSTDNPSTNVTAGANTRFILQSTGAGNRILHVEQESLYGPASLVEFKLANAKATLASNARIVPPVAAAATISFTNATVTSTTGVRNTHRGVRLNGQPLVYLHGSTFSKGAYGVYSYNTTLGNYISADQCNFLDCNTGMYVHDKGIIATGCAFDNCNDGLIAVQMAHTSYLYDCSARRNSGTGVSFQGSSTLNVWNPAFNYNAIGLSVGEARAVVACGSVGLNKRYGFKVHHGGTLHMDDNHSGHDPVTAVKNGTTIWCQLANNVYLDLGYNSLKPMVAGMQKSLYGTFLCQPYGIPQQARKNNWNGTVGTPLTSADYSITTCGAPLQFVDPSSSPEFTCGQVPLAVPGGSSEISGAPLPGLMDDCAGCAVVLGADSLPVALNVASLEALELGYNDSLPNNELLAMDAFHALLANPLPEPNDQEKFLLGYGHSLMLESYGDALEKGQLSTATDNAVLDSYWGMMTAMEDARIGAAAEGQDDFIFYTRLERAQITRAAGKYDDAIAQMQAIPQPVDTGEQALLSTILCYTQTERSVLDGTYTWDDVEAAMLQCTGHGGPKMMMQPVAEGPDASPTAQPALQPNPATSEVLVQGFADEDCTLRVLDITGRVVVQELRFTGKTWLPLADVQPGTYVCLITTSKARLWQGKLVVGR